MSSNSSSESLLAEPGANDKDVDGSDVIATVSAQDNTTESELFEHDSDELASIESYDNSQVNQEQLPENADIVPLEAGEALNDQNTAKSDNTHSETISDDHSDINDNSSVDSGGQDAPTPEWENVSDSVDVEDSHEKRYNAMPFRTRHYLYNYLWITSEAALHAWLTKMYETNPESHYWTFSYTDDLVWDRLERMQLANWKNLILGLPCEVFSHNRRNLCQYSIAYSLDRLRNATTHRQRICFNDARNVMNLTELLGDKQRMYEVQEIWIIALGGAHPDRQIMAYYEDILFQRKAPTKSSTALEVASYMIRLLEESCFRFLKHNPTLDPEIVVFPSVFEVIETGPYLEDLFPEAWEITDFYQLWNCKKYHRLDIDPVTPMENCEDLDGQFFAQEQLRTKVLGEARDLRDMAAHRNKINKWDLCHCTRSAVMLTILLGDRQTALEIEMCWNSAL